MSGVINCELQKTYYWRTSDEWRWSPASIPTSWLLTRGRENSACLSKPNTHQSSSPYPYSCCHLEFPRYQLSRLCQNFELSFYVSTGVLEQGITIRLSEGIISQSPCSCSLIVPVLVSTCTLKLTCQKCINSRACTGDDSILFPFIEMQNLTSFGSTPNHLFDYPTVFLLELLLKEFPLLEPLKLEIFCPCNLIYSYYPVIFFFKVRIMTFSSSSVSSVLASRSTRALFSFFCGSARFTLLRSSAVIS